MPKTVEIANLLWFSFQSQLMKNLKPIKQVIKTCEIGKERIRRAGEKIKEEYKDKEI
jgi:hypothetical protein